MPGLSPLIRAWILERMILQASSGNSHARSPIEKALTIGGDEVRHATTKPNVAVQPKPPIHCVDHSLPAQCELLPFVHQGRKIAGRRNGGHARFARQWQVTTPSGSPGNGGVVLDPEKTEQVSGNDCGWVALADQPPFVAAMMVSTTPRDVVYFSSDASVV